MEFNDLIADFSARHNIENLVVVDGAAALDIDGIIVPIVAKGDLLTLSAEIGEPPADGAAAFADLLLEANLQTGAFFAKTPGPGVYILVQRLSLSQIDGAAFDSALETLVNQAETWSRLLSDFRPVAKAAADRAEEERSSIKAGGFMQV